MSTAGYPYAPVEPHTHPGQPATPPSPHTTTSFLYYAQDPLDMARPPFRDDTSRESGSPDSNDQDQEVFITPANSARPSMFPSMVEGEDGLSLGTGLGIEMSSGGNMTAEQAYYMGMEMGEGDTVAKSSFSTPPLARSKSAESNLQARRAANNQLGWQTINTSVLPLAISDRALALASDDSSGHSSARSPVTSSSSTLPSQPNIRERVASPLRSTHASDASDPYFPHHLQIHASSSSSSHSTQPSPAADGKRELPVRPPLHSVDSSTSISSASHQDTTRSRNVRNAYGVPANVPTGHDFGAPRMWKAGDFRTRTVSGGERGYALTSSAPVEKEKFTDSQMYWLGLYFIFNLGLTLFNKFVLVSFPFPYTLTGLHALSGCIGCYIALERGSFIPARLTRRENIILGAFSVLYTINIAVSNISLQLVTVPFHQVVRASTPFFTILTSALLLGTRFTLAKMVALLPVVAGVGFATYGDYYFTAWGLILTLLGTFLAALKTVATNLIQTGGGGRLKLHPLDLLMRMSPLAFVQCVIYGWWTGELERVRIYGATQMTRGKAIALLINGVIACGLNIVSFTANKKSGPLTMTVSANCKQVMTIALAVVLFDLHISVTNAVGILLTLVGGGTYGWVEYRDKQRRLAKLERG